jgi:hypothetical protein
MMTKGQIGSLIQHFNTWCDEGDEQQSVAFALVLHFLKNHFMKVVNISDVERFILTKLKSLSEEAEALETMFSEVDMVILENYFWKARDVSNKYRQILGYERVFEIYCDWVEKGGWEDQDGLLNY